MTIRIFIQMIRESFCIPPLNSTPNVLANKYFELHGQVSVITTFLFIERHDNLATELHRVPQINLFQRDYCKMLVLWHTHCFCIEKGSLVKQVNITRLIRIQQSSLALASQGLSYTDDYCKITQCLWPGSLRKILRTGVPWHTFWYMLPTFNIFAFIFSFFLHIWMVQVVLCWARGTWLLELRFSWKPACRYRDLVSKENRKFTLPSYRCPLLHPMWVLWTECLCPKK